MVFMGCCSIVSSYTVAWTDEIIGPLAMLFSFILMINTLYCFLKAYKMETAKKKIRMDVYPSSDKSVVRFANKFYQMIEDEKEREFWKSKDA